MLNMSSVIGHPILQRFPIKQGFVQKLPPLLKAQSPGDFRKRWLILWDAEFEYFKDETCKKRKKRVNLVNCERIDPSYKHRLIQNDDCAFAVCHTSGRTFIFVAENPSEKASWCWQLEKAIKNAKDPIYAEIGGVSDLRRANSFSSLFSLTPESYFPENSIKKLKYHARRRPSSLDHIPTGEDGNRLTSNRRLQKFQSFVTQGSDSGISIGSRSSGHPRRSSLFLDPVTRQTALLQPEKAATISAGSVSFFVTTNAVKRRRFCTVSIYVDSGVMPCIDNYENQRILSPVVYIDVGSLDGPAFLYLPHSGRTGGSGWTLKAMTCSSGDDQIPIKWDCQARYPASSSQAMVSVFRGGWFCLVGEADNQSKNSSQMNVRVAVFGSRSNRQGTRWNLHGKIFSDSDDLQTKIKRHLASSTDCMRLLGVENPVSIDRSSAISLNVVDPNGCWESPGSLGGRVPLTPLWEVLEAFDSEQTFRFTLQAKEGVDVEVFSVNCEIRIVRLGERTESANVLEKTLWNVIEIEEPLMAASPIRSRPSIRFV